MLRRLRPGQCHGPHSEWEETAPIRSNEFSLHFGWISCDFAMLGFVPTIQTKSERHHDFIGDQCAVLSRITATVACDRTSIRW